MRLIVDDDMISVLQCVAMCCSVLQCVAVCCSVFQCVAVCSNALQCVAVCCSVLQCVAVCNVLQCVAGCCSKRDLQNRPDQRSEYAADCRRFHNNARCSRPCLWHAAGCSVLQRVCSVLQCVAECCRVLQSVAVSLQGATIS